MFKSILKKLFILRLVFAILLILLPFSAQASVVSFVSGLFGGNFSQEEIITSNSQNMPLLEAVVNSDSISIGGGDISVENNALVSEVGPSGSMVDISEKTSNDKISIYVVRKGDSLSQIAKMFDVSINTIIWANDLQKKPISEGQTLVILPVSGVKHSVVKGETLQSIAKKYKGNIDEIVQFNNLSLDSKIAIGDIVIVPDGEINIPVSNGVGIKNTKKVSEIPSHNGYYILPAKGRRSQGLHGYNAVDIAAPVGTPIVASASGDVIVSKDYGWNGGYGNYIVLKHNNGTQTLYGHASEVIVSVGQHIAQGQVIGYVGNTGKSTGPHLHFEIRGVKNPF